MTHYHDCLLCGANGPQVRMRLVEWAEPLGSKRFEHIPACVEAKDCRARVEGEGESWPLVETSSERTERTA